MRNLTESKNAREKYFSVLKLKAAPIISWEFKDNFQIEMKKAIIDLCKLNTLSVQCKWEKKDWDLKSKLKEKVIIITDDKLNIVFASHNMYTMNGYREKEVLGKSPKIFQGDETSVKVANEIREAIALQQPFVKEVMNYKKTGEPYSCLIEGFPVFNTKGMLVNFIAFEKAA